MITEDLFNEVYAYLCRHYEEKGNDILIETIEKADLRAGCGNAKTVIGAVKNLRKKFHSIAVGAYRDEIASTEW